MNTQIYIIGGKARAGKDTVAAFIKEEMEKQKKKHLNIQYSFYIKEYAKKISNWDGNENTKPRELLQKLGTDIIRKNLGDEFLIKKLVDDLKVYSLFFDCITVSDARLKKEIDIPKINFDNVKSIHIIRPNFDNGLTEEEKKHPTEIDLDDYGNFDYEIINDGSLDDLREKVVKLLKEVQNES